MSVCHYCKGPAGTADHIVAKAWLPKRGVPQKLGMQNKVPACAACNGRKGSKRSDCNCERCTNAWFLMGPYLLPWKKSDIPVITVEEIIAWQGSKVDQQ